MDLCFRTGENTSLKFAPSILVKPLATNLALYLFDATPLIPSLTLKIHLQLTNLAPTGFLINSQVLLSWRDFISSSMAFSHSVLFRLLITSLWSLGSSFRTSLAEIKA